MEHQRGAYAAVVDVRLHTAHAADVAHRVGTIIVEVQDDGFRETKLVEWKRRPTFSSMLVIMAQMRASLSSRTSTGPGWGSC